MARAAAGLLSIALVIPALSQTMLTIGEVRQRIENMKAAYKSDGAVEVAKSLDEAVDGLQAKYGDRIPVVALRDALLEIPPPETKPAPVPESTAHAPRKPPDGVTVEQTLDGFRLRAVVRNYFLGLFCLAFVGVLCMIPVRVFPDLVREVFHAEGWSLLAGGAFLAAFAGGVIYAAGKGAVASFGEVRITRAGDEGTVFTGIGSLGRTRHIRWSDFHGVADQVFTVSTGRRFDRTSHFITLTGSSKLIRFGDDLEDNQRAFIIKYLREQVYPSSAAEH